MKIDFKKFAVNTLNGYHLKEVKLDKNAALNFLSREIESDFKGLNQLDIQEKRNAFFKIKNCTASKYKEYCIETSKGAQIICGIRHLNLDKNNAFVSFKSDGYLNCKAIKEIYNKDLISLFSVFEPKYIQYFSKFKSKNNLVAQCTLLQMSDKIKATKLAPSYNFKFVNPTNKDYFEDYVAEYQKFHLAYPDLINRIPVNDLETMELSRQHNLLKLVYLDAKHIGWIAAENLNFLSARGVYFNEILLKQNMRGKGLAKYIQNQFIHDFVEDDTVVWGTIDFQNKASLRTALHNKRNAVRYEHFIVL